jgi:hypothetical protein
MGESPKIGDFLYLAVNAAFVNFPPDFVPSSRVAHTVAAAADRRPPGYVAK